jgi:hypothetical protein
LNDPRGFWRSTLSNQCRSFLRERLATRVQVHRTSLGGDRDDWPKPRITRLWTTNQIDVLHGHRIASARTNPSAGFRQIERPSCWWTSPTVFDTHEFTLSGHRELRNQIPAQILEFNPQVPGRWWSWLSSRPNLQDAADPEFVVAHG